MINPQVLLISELGSDAQVWAYGLRKRGISAATVNLEDTRTNLFQLDLCDLVAVDIGLGQEELFLFCRHLRPVVRGSILVFTYEHDERFLLQLYRAGADECVAKPIGTALALAKVMSWLRMDSLTYDTNVQGSNVLGNRLPGNRKSSFGEALVHRPLQPKL
jgi:DNA-binding response OmpR family regulator